MGGAAIRVRGDGLTLLGNIFLCIPGFIHVDNLIMIESPNRALRENRLHSSKNGTGNTPYPFLSSKKAEFYQQNKAFAALFT